VKKKPQQNARALDRGKIMEKQTMTAYGTFSLSRIGIYLMLPMYILLPPTFRLASLASISDITQSS